MRPRVMRTLLVLAETLFAWAMLDVLVCIVCAALLELDMVAKFTLGGECDAINAFLRNQTAIGDLMPGEPSCFGVRPTLDLGFAVCAIGALVSTLAGGYVTVSAHVALSEQATRSRAFE